MTEQKICDTCGGNGYVMEQTEDKNSEIEVSCPDCGGSKFNHTKSKLTAPLPSITTKIKGRTYKVEKVVNSGTHFKLTAHLMSLGYDGNIYLLTGSRGATRMAWRLNNGDYIITANI